METKPYRGRGIRQREPWHVLYELNDIAGAIEGFQKLSPLETMDSVYRYRNSVVLPLSASLYRRFDRIIPVHGIGDLTVRQWAINTLRNTGFSSFADDIENRLTKLLTMIEVWETKWRDTVYRGGIDVAEMKRQGKTVSVTDYFSNNQKQCEESFREFTEIDILAAETVAILKLHISERKHLLPNSPADAKPIESTMESHDGREQEQQSDGLHAPNLLVWGGKQTTVQPLPFRLLQIVWRKKPLRAESVVDELWGVTSDKTNHDLKHPITKANKALMEVAFPGSIGVKAGFVQWL